MRSDEIEAVYTDPDGLHYLACVGEERAWWRWPAEAGGWARRRRVAGADGCDELPARLARLALRLSGVPHDD